MSDLILDFIWEAFTRYGASTGGGCFTVQVV